MKASTTPSPMPWAVLGLRTAEDAGLIAYAVYRKLHRSRSRRIHVMAVSTCIATRDRVTVVRPA